jgi:RHS repeat-associated protein
VAWNLYGAGADEILVRYQQNPAGYLHYHLDAMGNVQFLLSDQPNPGLEKYTYDVFGKPTITGWNGDGRPISNHGNRFLFTGREYLYWFGMYDYRHRIYHPGLGRFIETDPLGQQIEGAKLSAEQTALFGDGAPEKFSSSESNLYRYCHNDPVSKSDPLGLTPGDPFDAPQDAARDAHNFINPTSIQENAEYGSIIYQGADGHFFASKPFSDGAGTRVVVGDPTDQSRVPKGGTRVGDYHSHGDYSTPGPKDPKTGIPIPQRVTGPNAKRDDAMRGYNSNHPSSPDDKRARDAKKKDPKYRTFLGTPSKEFKEYNGKKDWKL